MLAQRRLQKEAQAIAKEPPPYIRAKPLETDILHFHYVIEGPRDTPYAGGYYHGILRFPSEYPHKPPEIIMYTPSGRFDCGKALCLSMSSYHPESWNPVWSVATVLVGLQSFMVERTPTVGSIETSTEEKKRLAGESLAWNVKNNKDFRRLFPELVELHERRLAPAGGAGAAAAAAAAAGAAPAAAAAGGGGGGGGGAPAAVAGGGGGGEGGAPGAVVAPGGGGGGGVPAGEVKRGAVPSIVGAGIIIAVALLIAFMQRRRPEMTFA